MILGGALIHSNELIVLEHHHQETTLQISEQYTLKALKSTLQGAFSINRFSER
jgi:hypothetical protein